MKTVTLKEAQAPYLVAIDEAPLIDEVVILEKEGQAVAAVVPMVEYQAFRVWSEAERRRRAQLAEEEAVNREHSAFQKALPELLKKYKGRVVALYKGAVIAVGDDRMEVWQRAREQVGGAPVYVQTVAPIPRVYKLPHRKVVVDVGL